MITSQNPLIRQAMDQVDRMDDKELNEFVDYIRYTMKERARRRNFEALSNIDVGDRVMVAGNIKPQYMRGATGTVTEKKQSRVVIKLDSGPLKKFRNGIMVCTPAVLNKIVGE